MPRCISCPSPAPGTYEENAFFRARLPIELSLKEEEIKGARYAISRLGGFPGGEMNSEVCRSRGSWAQTAPRQTRVHQVPGPPGHLRVQAAVIPPPPRLRPAGSAIFSHRKWKERSFCPSQGEPVSKSAFMYRYSQSSTCLFNILVKLVAGCVGCRY